MKSMTKQIQGEELFIGIDLHKRRWHVTIRTADVEIFSNSIAGSWQELRKVLNRYNGCRLHAVYEAGYFGFWLFDHLTQYGVDCIVTPPSLIPQEHGNRVKTDRLDSRKLARLLAKGLLKSIWVPSTQERFHRQVIRRRRQLVGDRVRTQNRIKSELCFYGVDLPTPRGPWTQVYFANLQRIKFNNRWMQQSFNRLLGRLNDEQEAQLRSAAASLKRFDSAWLWAWVLVLFSAVPFQALGLWARRLAGGASSARTVMRLRSTAADLSR